MFYIPPTYFSHPSSYAGCWANNAVANSSNILTNEYTIQIKRFYEEMAKNESKDIKLIRSHKNLIITNI